MSTHVLPTYIRTLALLLHAAGPYALALPQMTAEAWPLLLHPQLLQASLAERAYPVLEAVLFALLVLLDVNVASGPESERIAQEHGRQLLETAEWAREVLAQIEAGPPADEDDGVGVGGEVARVRSTAAGVLVRCQEVIERWHRLMVGDMMTMG